MKLVVIGIDSSGKYQISDSGKPEIYPVAVVEGAFDPDDDFQLYMHTTGHVANIDADQYSNGPLFLGLNGELVSYPPSKGQVVRIGIKSGYKLFVQFQSFGIRA